MFKKKRGVQFRKEECSIIGKGLTFEGNIRSNVDMIVDRNIIGDIESQSSVIIGEYGSITANMSACNVIISGSVTGNVCTTDTLKITNAGELHGEINTKKLIIMRGGVFRGDCKMKKEDDLLNKEENSISGETDILNSDS